MRVINTPLFSLCHMWRGGGTKNKKTMNTYKCQQCDKDFESKKGCKSVQPKYCSRECYGVSMMMNKKCLLCGEVILNKHSASLKHRKYCSKECQGKSRLNKPFPEEWKKALSDGRKNSDKCKGENLYNWKGGKENTRMLTKERYLRTKHNIIGKLPRKALNKILDVQQNKCFYCESDLSTYKAIEHLTPITRDGDNSIYNLVYSCKSCNSKKRQQTLEEYAISQKRFDWIEKWENLYIELL